MREPSLAPATAHGEPPLTPRAPGPEHVHLPGGAGEQSPGRSIERTKAALNLVLPIVGLVALWQLVTVVFNVSNLVLPSPVVVAQTLGDDWSLLQPAIWPTLVETVLGFALAVVVGIAAAIAIVSSRLVERAVFPPLVAAQVIPKVALAPLFIVWFGYALLPKVMMAFFISFFPVVVGTVVGLRAANPQLILMAKSMGAGRVRIFRRILVMTALPNIFGGLKVAITLAVIGAVVGEFISANQGLGYLILTANGQLDTPLLCAALVLLSVVGLVLYGLVEVAERLVVPKPMRVAEQRP